MRLTPDFDAFSAKYEAGEAQVVWTTLVADLETPVSAMLKLADGLPNTFLLESVERGANRGRYSLIGLKPDLIWRCRGNIAEINRQALFDRDSFAPCPVGAEQGALASLRALVDESRIALPPGLPPMAAGVVGYMSYDMVRLMERLPNVGPDPIGIPDGIFLRPTVMAVFDSIEDIVTVVTPVRPRPGVSAAEALERARERLADVLADFERSLTFRRDSVSEHEDLPKPTSNMTRESFHAMVRKAKEYIMAGDIFQVVLGQRFSVPFRLSSFALYRALRRTNPSPFLFHLNFGDFALVGSSPEILVRVRAGKVTIRPLAGTRRRGKSEAEDKALAAELMADPKERAEHLMLLDLGRNDVGRVARIGTVRVTEPEHIEYYSQVMHIASNVEGELDTEHHDAMDALIGGFPAGTVSGAPKVRAMEIIDELEPEKRGFYAGCIGYFGADGDMDTCIALRTALVKDGVMYAQAGAGIVADSDPQSEFEESENKAKALIRAAEEAVRFAARHG